MGSKTVLTQRLHVVLSGLPFHEPAARRTAAAPLPVELDVDTVIPAGQRSTQRLRAWFTQQVGPGFCFDGAVRAYVCEGNSTRTWRSAHPDGSREDLVRAWQGRGDRGRA